MNIISLNAGNNFLKFSLYDMNHESVIASGLFERIGLEGSQYQMNYHNNRITQEISIATHQEAVNLLLEKLIDLRIIPSLDSIDGVGHRIVVAPSGCEIRGVFLYLQQIRMPYERRL